MIGEFNRYIDRTGKFNFEGAEDEILISAFKQIELFPPNKTLSDKTVKAYKQDLNDFLEFLKREKIKLSNVNVIVLQEYTSMLNATLSKRSAKRKLGILKRLVRFGYEYSFYGYTMENQILLPKISKANISEAEDGEKAERRQMDLATAKLLIKGLSEIVVTKQEPIATILKNRNELIGYFLLTTGMRASEIINLDWKNISKYDNSYSVTCLGKGRKHRTIPLKDEVVDRLFKLRELNNLEGDFRTDDSPIFTAYSREIGKRLSYLMLYKLVKKACHYVDEQIIGINTHISPHWFRHTFVTTALEQNLPLVVVKELAGHADVSTTNIYIEEINERVLRKNIDKIEFDF